MSQFQTHSAKTRGKRHKNCGRWNFFMKKNIGRVKFLLQFHFRIIFILGARRKLQLSEKCHFYHKDSIHGRLLIFLLLVSVFPTQTDRQTYRQFTYFHLLTSVCLSVCLSVHDEFLQSKSARKSQVRIRRSGNRSWRCS